MINLFNIPKMTVKTGSFNNLLHGDIVSKFEENFASYLGMDYALALNSASTAIMLSLMGEMTVIKIPSILPHVVLNAIRAADCEIMFVDEIDWVGGSYLLYAGPEYQIVDSAQEIDPLRMFIPDNLYIYSFYPTKPVGSCDGGMIVSNNKKVIDYLRIWAYNGTNHKANSWERVPVMPFGYKAYMNSIQAYIANENLKRLDEKNYKLALVKKQYNEAFGLKNTSYHLYRIQLPFSPNNLTHYNESFVKLAYKEGIACGIHYKPLHLMEAYEKRYPCEGNMDKSVRVGKTTVSIPYHEKLTQKEINKVIRFVKSHIK